MNLQGSVLYEIEAFTVGGSNEDCVKMEVESTVSEITIKPKNCLSKQQLFVAFKRQLYVWLVAVF